MFHKKYMIITMHSLLKVQKAEEAWNTLFADYCAKYPECKALWDKFFGEVDAQALLNDEEYWAYEDKAVATRALSGTMINRLKDRLPNLFAVVLTLHLPIKLI